MTAARQGYLSVLAFLLEKGADIHAHDDVNEQLGIIYASTLYLYAGSMACIVFGFR